MSVDLRLRDEFREFKETLRALRKKYEGDDRIRPQLTACICILDGMEDRLRDRKWSKLIENSMSLGEMIGSVLSLIEFEDTVKLDRAKSKFMQALQAKLKSLGSEKR